MFGKMFGKKKGAAQAAMKKIENRDLMEAIVAGSLLIAAADGEIEPEEIDTMGALIASNESLKHFGNEIDQTIQKYQEMLEASFLVGKTKLKRELQDCANNSEEAEEIFVNMIAIAQADGEIEPAEFKVLVEMGRVLGQNLSNYGITEADIAAA